MTKEFRSLEPRAESREWEVSDCKERTGTTALVRAEPLAHLRLARECAVLQVFQFSTAGLGSIRKKLEPVFHSRRSRSLACSVLVDCVHDAGGLADVRERESQ